MMTHPLLPKLRALRLSGMLETLDTRAAQATERNLTPTEFLAIMLDDELERRDQTRLRRLVTEAGIDPGKTLAQFDFAAAPQINRALVMDWADCTFVHRGENILLSGPTGTGKSHLANAIAWPLGVAMPVAGMALLPDTAGAATMIAVGVVCGLLMGVLVGAITGFALVYLLGHRGGSASVSH